MARWRELPDDLDPQVREFAGQLRRLVDRSRLSVSAVADRTGYSKSSWERYLGGRLLPPLGAVMALAEVTGAEPDHLTTMWELAERAWSRAEMRHDPTLEAISIAEARAALGEFGPPPGGPAAKRRGRRPAPARPDPPRRGRRAGPVAVLLAVALVLIAGGVYAAGRLGGDDGAQAQPDKPSGSHSATKLPRGVKCVGSGCTGKDPETMRCGGELADTTAQTYVGGAYLEVRYSQVCRAAWARISSAGSGDAVRITSGQGQRTVTERAKARPDDAGYTAMVAAPNAADARACAFLTTGTKGCTPVGTPSPGATDSPS